MSLVRHVVATVNVCFISFLIVMDVVSLSANRQKHTLSGKKQAKRKVSARNTLSTPYSPYWPVVSPEDEAELECTINTLLPFAKRSYTHIPCSELRKLTKEQRREKRKCSSETSNLSGSLILGVNGVSRALERGALSCAVVAGDVQPRVLVSHLAMLSAVRGLPLVVLSSLRHLTQATLGFSCIALGLKIPFDCGCFQKNVADGREHHLHPLLELVTRLWKGVPQPDFLSSYLCTPVADTCPEDSSASEPEPGDSPVSIKDLYLHRTSRKQRVFVPGISEPSPKSTGLPTFISLQSDNGEHAVPSSVNQQHQPKTQFLPLKIKRIQPNPNKIRKRKKGSTIA